MSFSLSVCSKEDTPVSPENKVTNSSGVSSVIKSSSYIVNDYNTYGITWEENKIEFYLNGVLTSTYNKPANTTSAQWPFDKPFYLILNQSGGVGCWTYYR